MPPVPRSARRQGYDGPSRLLHWLTALAILAALALGLWMTGLPAESEDEVAIVFRGYSLHKTLGVAALALGAAHILRALTHPGPGPLHPRRRTETFLARLTHRILWLGMLALPVTGLLHHSAAPGFAPILWPFGQTLPLVPADEALALIFRSLHEVAGWLLMAALALHVAGTMKHMLIDRDATLARMIRGTGPAVPRVRASRAAAVAAVALWTAVLAAGLLTAPRPDPDPFDAIEDFETLEIPE